MSKFIYRMQNILEIKDKMEQQAKNEFAAANMRAAQEEEKLAFCLDKRGRLEEAGRELLLADKLSIPDIEENKKLVAHARASRCERRPFRSEWRKRSWRNSESACRRRCRRERRRKF